MKMLFVMERVVGTRRNLLQKLCEQYRVETEIIDRKARKRNAETFNTKLKRILMELTNLVRLPFRLTLYRKYDIIVSVARQRHLSHLIFARFLKLFRINLKLYLYGFYGQSWIYSRITKLLLHFLLTENVALTVQCKNEVELFQGIAPNVNVWYYPFCSGPMFSANEIISQMGDYVFAGGHSNRDYDSLLECAANLGDIKFIIVCSRLTKITKTVPCNVIIYKDLDFRPFHILLARSRLVVVPLLRDIGSSGQSVALAAMQYGKATVYPKLDAISQYFCDGITGICYTPHKKYSLCSRIAESFPETDRLLSIGEAAKKIYYAQYTGDKFDDAILSHIEEFSVKFQ
jgi:hypothetical protein